MPETEKNRNIELSAERKIAFTENGKSFIYTIRPITEKDWLKYFNSITVESERDGGDTVQRVDIRSAGIQLVEDCLVFASGYAVRDASGKAIPSGMITDVPGWIGKLPQRHKLAVADRLTEVGPFSGSGSFEFAIGDAEDIQLSAVWGTDEDGVMRRYDGLKHFIAQPNAEQSRRYMRSMSETRVAGSRSGRTIYRSSAPLLAKLYDELIQRVDGYFYKHEPLGANVEAIRAQMDTYHKVAAMKQIFATPEDETEMKAAA